MLQIFFETSPYKKQARFIAVLWTLLIFVLCFMPGKDLPKIDAPFIDKWVHFLLFGGFSFLWLCANPSRKLSSLAAIFVRSVALGAFIELMQGALPALGRACEFLDAVADAIGASIGIIVFCAAAGWATRKR